MRRLNASVDAAAQALEFVFYSQLFFLEGGDPDFVPIGVGHLGFDLFLEFFVLFGQFLHVSI